MIALLAVIVIALLGADVLRKRRTGTSTPWLLGLAFFLIMIAAILTDSGVQQ